MPSMRCLVGRSMAGLCFSLVVGSAVDDASSPTPYLSCESRRRVWPNASMTSGLRRICHTIQTGRLLMVSVQPDQSPDSGFARLGGAPAGEGFDCLGMDSEETQGRCLTPTSWA